MSRAARHERASVVFLDALARPLAQREAFLAVACDGDPELLSQVRALLAHDGTLELDAAALGLGVDALVAHTERQLDVLPETVGPFRVLEHLGSGSTGVVFRALQEQPRREVAVKLLRGPAADERLVRRLAFEAEVLARLDHPGIAHVYAAGWHEGTGGALPYLAMELVHGRTLIRWADETGASLEARLTLLADICDAVAHAHGRGVIHRDLKPENILVTEDGRPKVLDFGIARMASPDGDATTWLTGPGQLLGTLAYMSPEQVGPAPETLDTRADVYALGVIAYRLLAGRAPYELGGLPLHEAAARIRRQDAPLLGRVDRRLRGDVEIIVAKALQKEPVRRYTSAAELGADLRRHLAGEPITARPEGSWRQVRRLVRRHPLLALAVAVLVAAPFVTTFLQREATRALKRQTVEQRTTQAAWADMLANTALGDWGGEESVSQLMARADVLVPHYARGDAGLEGSLWAMVGRCLANAEVVPGQWSRAEAALEKGVDLQAEVFGEDDPRTLSALVDLAEFEVQHGAADRAAALLRRFETHAADVFEPGDERLLAARLLQGRLEAEAGRTERGAALLEQVVALGRRRFGEDGDLVLAAVGALATTCERYEALDALLTTLTARLDAGARDEATVRALLRLTGLQLSRPGIEASAVLDLERRALAAFEADLGPEAPVTRLYWNHHASQLADLGEVDAAEEILRTSLDLLRDAPGPGTRPTLACELQLAELYAEDGRSDRARDAFTKILAEFPRSRFAIHDLLTRATRGLCDLETRQGHHDQAARHLAELESWLSTVADDAGG